MAIESIVEKLKDAKDEDMLINGKYDSDLYRLVYILKELISANGIYKLDVVYCHDSLIEANNGKYNITIKDQDYNPILCRFYSNEKELIEDLKDLISKHYNRNQWIITRCMTSISLTKYWQPMYKFALYNSKEEE
jgi:hypothetical protein